MSVLTAIYLQDPGGPFVAGDEVQLSAQFETTLPIAVGITAGSTITSITTPPLAAPVATGDLITLTNPAGESQVFQASGNAIVTATTIPVTSAAVGFNFPLGSSVSYLVDPATVSIKYQTAPGQATQTITYAGGEIIKAAKGSYFANIDTTGLPGNWVLYWVGTSPGQALSAATSFTVNPAPFT